jgi:NAD(P)-dependent dehydrogenase (short-subunit alcohol dehydrogenase family)
LAPARGAKVFSPGETDPEDQVQEALDMTGKSAIVTGGCRGIGRAIAERFLEAGAEVVVCARHEPPELPSAGAKKARFVAADVRELGDIDRVLSATVGQIGHLDVLVNNAGGAPPVEAASASPRFHRAIIELNLLAPLNFAQRANSVMQEQDAGGCIINIGSVSGMRPSPTAAAYGAAKAGLVSLAQTLAVEWAPKVRVNTVSAGLVLTEQAREHYGDDEAVEAMARTVPLLRMGSPRDVADACLFLASPLASYVTGENLVLHGGGEVPAYLAVAQSPGAAPGR